MTEKVKVRIVGSCAIAGVAPGGTVDLDPGVTNVPALVSGGHVQLIPARAPKPVGPDSKTEVTS